MCALEYTSIRDLTWNSYMTEEDMYNLKILYSLQPPILSTVNWIQRISPRIFYAITRTKVLLQFFKRWEDLRLSSKAAYSLQHSQKLWKIVGEIWRVSLEMSDTDSIWTRIFVNGKILWNATLASLPWELSKRNFVFLFLFYVAVNMIRQIKLAFVPNYYSGNFVKFECWTYQFFEPIWFQNAFVLFFSTRVT